MASATDTEILREQALQRKGDRVIQINEFCAIVNIHRTTVHRKLKTDPDFPRPIRVCRDRLSFWESDAYVYLLKKQDAAA